ncbi:MAG: peptidyl-prolyl cis-trans isomerase [candidate division KSB1 bacterium]|nr:peptidyl-prolyl cis-trans isomerase [candidate division KSB1 bacterium]MDZ7318594.1 peptidyl-prolyl cis-trans isomerase [candidate division KSB1 bacterium]
MIKKLLIGLLYLGLILACGSNSEKNKQQVLISIGNATLTLDQLKKDLPPTSYEISPQDQVNNYIQRWIETELIYQDALKTGVDKSDELQEELEQAKRDLVIRKYLEKYLARQAEVSEEAALSYYEENKDSFIRTSDEIKALHILVASLDKANQARRRIVGGEDFETVAREVISDSTALARIQLEYFSADDVIPEISQSLFTGTVQPGIITNPIRSNFGYHIFKIVDVKRRGSYREFEEVKSQILARLNSMKQNERYRDLIIELRNKISIKKNDELLKSVYSESKTINMDSRRENE